MEFGVPFMGRVRVALNFGTGRAGSYGPTVAEECAWCNPSLFSLLKGTSQHFKNSYIYSILHVCNISELT